MYRLSHWFKKRWSVLLLQLLWSKRWHYRQNSNLTAKVTLEIYASVFLHVRLLCLISISLEIFFLGFVASKQNVRQFLFFFLCCFCSPKQSCHYFCGSIFPRAWNQRCRVVPCDLLTSVLAHFKKGKFFRGAITSKEALFSPHTVNSLADTTVLPTDNPIHLWRLIQVYGWENIFVSPAVADTRVDRLSFFVLISCSTNNTVTKPQCHVSIIFAVSFFRVLQTLLL